MCEPSAEPAGFVNPGQPLALETFGGSGPSFPPRHRVPAVAEEASLLGSASFG